MDNGAVQYRTALMKKLRCSKEVKDRLMAGFDNSLTAFLEENPAPTPDDLYAAFGPPQEMAEILMAQITP